MCGCKSGCGCVGVGVSLGVGEGGVCGCVRVEVGGILWVLVGVWVWVSGCGEKGECVSV